MDQFSNFKNFLYYIWINLALPAPTLLQYDIADFLQQLWIKRKIIQSFRGIGKTWITAAYACWRLYKNKNEKILIVSASLAKAVEISTFIKKLIEEIDILKHLKPNVREGDRDSVLSFDVAGCVPAVAPSIKVLGIGGQLTGSRATLIIADDIETHDNCKSQIMREKINDAIDEFESIITVDGEIIYLGTPHIEDSLYIKLANRGYDTKIWPSRFPVKELLGFYEGSLGDYILSNMDLYPNEPTEPSRFNEDVLLDKEAKIGRTKFLMQFMLIACHSASDKRPLKLADLIVMDLDLATAPEKVVWASNDECILNDLPSVGLNKDRFHKPMWVSDKWVNYSGIVMAIDPSGRGKDETSYSVTASLNGYVFILDCGGVTGGYDDTTLKFLTLKAAKHKVNKIIIESNFGDGMFTTLLNQVLRVYYPCTTEEIRHSTQKELRIIDTLEPVMNCHKLVINKQIVKQDIETTKNYSQEQQKLYQLFYQLTRITRDRNSLRHDDRLEALYMGVKYWLDVMNLIPDEEIKARKDAEYNKQVEEWFGDWDIYNPNKKSVWLSL